MKIRPLIFLLLSLLCRPFGAAAVTFLPGSCIDAGFRTCCDPDINDNNCAGLPGVCYCDPSCYEFDDCCSDIRVVCPTQQDELLPKEPLLKQAKDVTFHSAKIHWTVSQNSSNETYTVHYHARGSNSTTTVMMDTHNNTCAAAHKLPGHCVLLTGLDAGTTYYLNVVATNTFGSRKSSITSFTTMEYSAVGHVTATLVNTTAVKVSWSPLELPRGVRLIHYTIYYIPERDGSIKDVIILPSKETCGTIGQLMSQMTYEIHVTATVKDIDSNTTEGPRSLRSTIFVPAAAFIQLRGGPFVHCSTWNAVTEKHVQSVFHTATLDALSTYCACNYSEAHITSELVLCDTDVPTSIVYRATIRSTPDHTIAQLLSYMEEWVAESPVISSDSITLDKECAVRINLMSGPLCREVSKPEDSGDSCPCEKTERSYALQAVQNSTESSDSGDCVSISIFVTTLFAELLLLLAILMAVIVIILCISKQGRKASVEIEQPVSLPPQTPILNVYVEQKEPVANTAQTQE